MEHEDHQQNFEAFEAWKERLKNRPELIYEMGERILATVSEEAREEIRLLLAKDLGLIDNIRTAEQFDLFMTYLSERIEMIETKNIRSTIRVTLQAGTTQERRRATLLLKKILERTKAIFFRPKAT